MRDLTDRQREVLAFIAQSTRNTGYPPTIREIGEHLSIRSTNGVNDHLKALERKGLIERDESKSRAMQVTGPGMQSLGLTSTGRASGRAPVGGSPSANAQNIEARDVFAVPLLGRIAAGTPIEAIETTDERFMVDASMFPARSRGDIFALKVRGDSMIEDGIFDGDTILVKRQSEALKGEIVAVWIDGAATVKRYYREGDTIRLEPANAALKPIFVRAADARDTMILGKVVAVWRTLH
jgi:repressor LexA